AGGRSTGGRAAVLGGRGLAKLDHLPAQLIIFRGIRHAACDLAAGPLPAFVISPSSSCWRAILAWDAVAISGQGISPVRRANG
ncbi:MAG: hypothetical protein WBX37_25460, partial [Pseudolabrys sp.]